MQVNNDVQNIIRKIEQENKFFADRSALDSLVFPSTIHGRQVQIEQLVRILSGCKNGSAIPFVSVYGKSGSGKSTLVKYVCEQMSEIETIFVNLRHADTIFGAVNLILSELGLDDIQRTYGLAPVVKTVSDGIKSRLNQSGKKFCVLVLDEFDVILGDRRNKPSDFMYKLVEIKRILGGFGIILTVIGIANNALSEYGLDDRVKSRIGSVEIFFEPYDGVTVLEILKERSTRAFSYAVGNDILQYCSEMASLEHGDARKALDLLKTAGDLAASENCAMSRTHVSRALDRMQNDRISDVLSRATPHFRRVCAAFARLAYLTGQQSHSTTDIWKQYCMIRLDHLKPLGYRQVSSLIKEMEDIGLVQSQASYGGQHGFNLQHNLVVSAEMIGKTFGTWWDDVVQAKETRENILQYSTDMTSCSEKRRQRLEEKYAKEIREKKWKEFVGIN
jgi:cell division control protein 6